MRTKRFIFLCDLEERRLIRVVAETLRRSQGDALRYLVYKAARELGLISQNEFITHQDEDVGYEQY
jgi:hypothetical protein